MNSRDEIIDSCVREPGRSSSIRVVDQDVECTKGVNGRLDQNGELACIRDVTNVRHSLTSGRPNAVNNRVDLCRRPGRHGNGRASLSETAGNGSADSAAAARDEGEFPSKEKVFIVPATSKGSALALQMRRDFGCDQSVLRSTARSKSASTAGPRSSTQPCAIHLCTADPTTAKAMCAVSMQRSSAESTP